MFDLISHVLMEQMCEDIEWSPSCKFVQKFWSISCITGKNFPRATANSFAPSHCFLALADLIQFFIGYDSIKFETGETCHGHKACNFVLNYWYTFKYSQIFLNFSA